MLGLAAVPVTEEVPSMRLGRFAFVAAVMSFTTLAFAQESEFRGKMQEDMDGYKKQIINNCGTPASLTMTYNGKLGSNPRETKDGNYSAVSTLCTSALEGLADACRNGAVKASMSKVTTITCQAGKGTIKYNLKAPTLTFSLDAAYDKNNPAGQRDDLVEKIKKDLDK